ncbi:hypothetical protein Ciccas_004537 [Cichlidogyrus casuarinus]|uniref:Uncharacterized protein n=1 Tax=Cichlidogyrus casuarinus TaxID=1844966 RepID=A0ABD2QB71_9PLAT
MPEGQSPGEHPVPHLSNCMDSSNNQSNGGVAMNWIKEANNMLLLRMVSVLMKYSSSFCGKNRLLETSPSVPGGCFLFYGVG